MLTTPDFSTPPRSSDVPLEVGLQIDPADREIMSGLRIQLAFTIFTVVITASLTALDFGFVSHIFGTLTPSIRADLEQKALRACAQIARDADLGIAVKDAAQIERNLGGYESEPDVIAIVAVDIEGHVVFTLGTPPAPVPFVLSGSPDTLRYGRQYVSAWTPSIIEGTLVGRVAVIISTARLQAGSELERRILWGAVVGGVFALLAALLFLRFYIRPLIQVTERTFARLQRTTRAALEASRVKGEFLANMSHEIRTPMNGVLGMIELLAGTALPPKQRRLVETLDRSAHALMTILNDILDFSKIEAGKLKIVYRPTAVREVLEQVTALFSPGARAKQIDVTWQVEQGVPEVLELDPDRLRQIVSNLVGNALKFTEQGCVTLRCRLESGSKRARFEVEDTGIGISAEFLPRLFDAFVQADGSLTRRHGGTGLGLTICKQLVALMGGEIGVSSQLGAGSRFWFSLPLREPRQSVERLSNMPAQRVRTLIVDDDDAARRSLAELLARWEIPTVSVDGAEAALCEIEAAERSGETFGLVLSDLDMPDVDGASLARTLARTQAGARTPFILLTSSEDDAFEATTRDCIDGHLPKPIRERELLRTMNALLTPGGRRRVTPPPSAPRAAFSRPVLVVEDNSVNQVVMTETLAQLGYASHVVDNGQLAIEALEQRHYPLVFMDCQMPVLDGYQACVEIRRRHAGRQHVPIIAVTAHAFDGEREKALAAGMDDYIPKPITHAALRQALRRRWPDGAAEAGAMSSDKRRLDGALAGGEGARRPSSAVVQAFLRLVPGQIAALQAAAERSDAAELARAAHKLKGACLAVRAADMAELCARLEANPHDRAELCQRLSREFEQVAARLRKAVPDVVDE